MKPKSKPTFQTQKTRMKKLTFLLSFMMILCAGIATLSAHNPVKPLKHVVKPAATFSAALSKGAAVSGAWVIEFSGSAGTFQFPFNNGSTISVPSGTYQVGIHAAGGTSTSYSIAGSVCTVNYSTFGTSALWTNVPCTCSNGSFSIN